MIFVIFLEGDQDWIPINKILAASPNLSTLVMEKTSDAASGLDMSNFTGQISGLHIQQSKLSAKCFHNFHHIKKLNLANSHMQIHQLTEIVAKLPDGKY